jgi:glutamate decarboxylase
MPLHEHHKTTDERPGAQIVGQYYAFLRYGKQGYTEVHQASRDTARYAAEQVAAMGPYELVSDGSELPVFAFKLKDGVENFTVYDVSDHLRGRGWHVPAYSFPPDLEDTHVIRVVVRNGFGRDLADAALADLRRTTEFLQGLDRPLPRPHERPKHFHH